MNTTLETVYTIIKREIIIGDKEKAIEERLNADLDYIRSYTDDRALITKEVREIK